MIRFCFTKRVTGFTTALLVTTSGFIRRDFTSHIKGAKESALSRYRLSDNYLRFYLKYIEKNKNKIANHHFDRMALSALPGHESIMGLQFENLVLNNRAFIWEKLHLSPEMIVADNPYFQKAQVRKKGCLQKLAGVTLRILFLKK